MDLVGGVSPTQVISRHTIDWVIKKIKTIERVLLVAPSSSIIAAMPHRMIVAAICERIKFVMVKQCTEGEEEQKQNKNQKWRDLMCELPLPMPSRPEPGRRRNQKIGFSLGFRSIRGWEGGEDAREVVEVKVGGEDNVRLGFEVEERVNGSAGCEGL
ncbi:hypothetical protein LR48_Vigan04g005200 [Vigna angularis]|uniref:Uncharacterized protein n=1 Tax=Phaseolus angularis TaxID=3914 RepID=A0A0L9UBE3_PHAAN|nr:hypothetical protein LR48_Vigan04g005200 [Vigna angularis]